MKLGIAGGNLALSGGNLPEKQRNMETGRVEGWKETGSVGLELLVQLYLKPSAPSTFQLHELIIFLFFSG